MPCVTCESKRGGVASRVQKHPLCSLPARTSSRGPGSPLGPTFLRSLLLWHDLPKNNPPHTASPGLQVQTWAGPPGAPVTGPTAPPKPPALTRCSVLSPQDPVPPELTRLLQQSQDPLLKVLFPADPEDKSPEEPSGQNRAPVLTVVSKFKVGPAALTPRARS